MPYISVYAAHPSQCLGRYALLFVTECWLLGNSYGCRDDVGQCFDVIMFAKISLLLVVESSCYVRDYCSSFAVT